MHNPPLSILAKINFSGIPQHLIRALGGGFGAVVVAKDSRLSHNFDAGIDKFRHLVMNLPFELFQKCAVVVQSNNGRSEARIDVDHIIRAEFGPGHWIAIAPAFHRGFFEGKNSVFHLFCSFGYTRL
jgi:hypothetical protein